MKTPKRLGFTIRDERTVLYVMLPDQRRAKYVGLITRYCQTPVQRWEIDWDGAPAPVIGYMDEVAWGYLGAPTLDLVEVSQEWLDWLARQVAEGKATLANSRAVNRYAGETRSRTVDAATLDAVLRDAGRVSTAS